MCECVPNASLISDARSILVAIGKKAFFRSIENLSWKCSCERDDYQEGHSSQQGGVGRGCQNWSKISEYSSFISTCSHFLKSAVETAEQIEICSVLIIKTPEWGHWLRCFYSFVFDFDN